MRHSFTFFLSHIHKQEQKDANIETDAETLSYQYMLIFPAISQCLQVVQSDQCISLKLFLII